MKERKEMKKVKQYNVYSFDDSGTGAEVIGYVLLPDHEALLNKIEELEEKLYSVMLEKEDNDTNE